MRRTRNGSYRRSAMGEHEFSAFIPNPLPPIPPLDLDQFHQPLEKAHIALGYMDAVTTRLPSVEPLRYSYLRREAVASSQIEGTRSTFEDLLSHEMGGSGAAPREDAAETANYVAALEHGIRRLREGFPLSNRLIREVHAQLMQEPHQSRFAPGEFRRTQNWIGGASPGTALYVPPPPDEVPGCMNELEQFINDERSALPVLIKAGLAHAQFESIHPFLDGNGRAGRVLIALILEQEEMLTEPVLYLSLYFKQRRPQYYALLGQLREGGDWELWLQYFIDGVIWTAEDCINKAEDLSDQLEADRRRLVTLGRRAPSAEQVLEAYARRPLSNLRQLAEISGLAVNSAAAATDQLIEMGIVRETTGRRRSRLFAYDAYMEILSEGLEPL